MQDSVFLIPHICAGIIAFLAGMTALFTRKGMRAHRIAGNVFFLSMLVMSSGGAYMATFVDPVKINVIAGVLTFCLVATGWLTVIRREGTAGRLEYALLVPTTGVAGACLLLAWEAAASPTGRVAGVPAVGYLIFGSIAILCAVADIRLLINGGIGGSRRIARHLWRMCLALSITTLSLFLGTPNKLLVPDAIRLSWLRFVPLILVLGAFAFWLWRVSRAGRNSTAAAPAAT